jgi:hypothetical protein
MCLGAMGKLRRYTLTTIRIKEKTIIGISA